MQDPLNCNLTTLDTRRQVLREGKMQLLIKEVEIVANSKNTGRMMKVTFATTAPQPDMANNTQDPGFQLFDNIMIDPTGASTWDIVLRRLGEFVQSSRLTGEYSRGNIDTWYKMLEGRMPLCQVGFEPEGNRDGKYYEAKNTIDKYLKQ